LKKLRNEDQEFRKKKLRQISEHLEEILNLKIKSFESGSKRILKNSKPN